ncbi:hypothetical protein E2320_007759 [Naja naja]|nr:hypothetical protein E2320_007759 [Naja naja]
MFCRKGANDSEEQLRGFPCYHFSCGLHSASMKKSAKRWMPIPSKHGDNYHHVMWISLKRVHKEKSSFQFLSVCSFLSKHADCPM